MGDDNSEDGARNCSDSPRCAIDCNPRNKVDGNPLRDPVDRPKLIERHNHSDRGPIDVIKHRVDIDKRQQRRRRRLNESKRTMAGNSKRRQHHLEIGDYYHGTMTTVSARQVFTPRLVLSDWTEFIQPTGPTERIEKRSSQALTSSTRDARWSTLDSDCNKRVRTHTHTEIHRHRSVTRQPAGLDPNQEKKFIITRTGRLRKLDLKILINDQDGHRQLA